MVKRYVRLEESVPMQNIIFMIRNKMIILSYPGLFLKHVLKTFITLTRLKALQQFVEDSIGVRLSLMKNIRYKIDNEKSTLDWKRKI